MYIVLCHQSQPVEHPGVLLAAGHEIDPGGIDAGMAQHVRQFYDIGALALKNAREQVPQVVREHLPRRDVRRPAGRLHLCPYLFSPQAPAASGEEYLAGGGFVFSCIVQELAPQPGRYQYGAYLALEGDLGLSPPGRLDGDISQLADADAGGTDGLHHQREPPLRAAHTPRASARGPGRGTRAAVCAAAPRGSPSRRT